MALMVCCEKHNVGYVVADIYSEWWREAGIPTCPYCRMEWLEEHKSTWDLSVSWEIFYASTLLAKEKCVVRITMNVVSDEGISGYCDSDPLLVALYKASWWLRAKHLMRDAFWRIWFGLRIFLQGESDY